MRKKFIPFFEPKSQNQKNYLQHIFIFQTIVSGVPDPVPLSKSSVSSGMMLLVAVLVGLLLMRLSPKETDTRLVGDVLLELLFRCCT